MTKQAEKILPIKQESAIETAQKVIEQEKKRIVELCGKEIDEVLKRHDCTLDVVFSYDPNNKLRKQAVIVKK